MKGAKGLTKRSGIRKSEGMGMYTTIKGNVLQGEQWE